MRGQRGCHCSCLSWCERAKEVRYYIICIHTDIFNGVWANTVYHVTQATSSFSSLSPDLHIWNRSEEWMNYLGNASAKDNLIPKSTIPSQSPTKNLTSGTCFCCRWDNYGQSETGTRADFYWSMRQKIPAENLHNLPGREHSVATLPFSSHPMLILLLNNLWVYWEKKNLLGRLAGQM